MHLEDIALQRRQGFALGAEADALVVGQFVRQRGDFDVFGLNDLGIPFRLFDQRLNQCRHLGFGSGFQVQLIEFSEWIQVHYCTAKALKVLEIIGFPQDANS
jgi:hypothetical protein